MYKNVTYPARELFDRIWKTPVLQLAREIGVSDVALSKACRKACISLLRRGHWVESDEKRPNGRNPATTSLEPQKPGRRSTRPKEEGPG